MNSDTHMKFIDICCGIGGFHQALSNMGMKCVMASDIDENCIKNYKLNYGITPQGDISKIDSKNIPFFDVLCAGFPCQPFSKSGHQKGFKDYRGNIFFELCRIIRYHTPKYIILENVRNLGSHDGGNTWDIIKKEIDDMGYFTYQKPLILNTLYFGVPQSRERVIILCKKKDLGSLPQLPEISKKNIKNTSLDTIMEKKCSPKYNIKGKLKVGQEVWGEFLTILNQNKISIPKFPIWTDWWDSDGKDTTVTKINKKLSEEENAISILNSQKKFYQKYKNWIDKNRFFYKTNIKILQEWLKKSRNIPEWKGSMRKMEWQCGLDNLNMEQTLWTPRGSGVRIKKTDYSPTLVAMTSMIPVYGLKQRQLTPRECVRLQSFPESYIIDDNDKISYKQIGNAVNVQMIEKSARFLINNEPLFD